MRLGQIECGLEPIVIALDHEGTLSDIDNAGDTSLPWEWVLRVAAAPRSLLAREPKVMSPTLGIVYRAMANHLITKAGVTVDVAQTRAVTLIERST